MRRRITMTIEIEFTSDDLDEDIERKIISHEELEALVQSRVSRIANDSIPVWNEIFESPILLSARSVTTTPYNIAGEPF